MIKKVNKRGSNKVKVTFVLPENHPHAADMHVVGDFNNWEEGRNKFVRRSNQTYSTNVMLKEGQRYAFRYYSPSNGWENEPNADAFEHNEHGSDNCIIVT
ncbi:isoamylase [Longibacter salinarum]|uniref:Isoamylase n=1 Tax=Longibacter salinarum TaxID=1850348 RepID=A0A2A8D1W8_9BACT|nr:isoamylase early set domain-containing protein [Longibacter salinarum]PEN14949.1 isoamylase [Longibacter salinarum]